MALRGSLFRAIKKRQAEIKKFKEIEKKEFTRLRLQLKEQKVIRRARAKAKFDVLSHGEKLGVRIRRIRNVAERFGF